MIRNFTLCITLLLSVQFLSAQEELCDYFSEWDSFNFEGTQVLGYTQDDAYTVTADEEAYGDVNGWIAGIGGGSGLIHFEMSGEEQIAQFTINYFSLFQLGFHVNGSSDFVPLGSNPITVDGVDVTLEVIENGQPIQALLTFEGEIDAISLMTLESSIESLCVASEGGDSVSIDEQQQSATMAYPNPALEILNIVSNKSMLSADIYNVSGKLVQSNALFGYQKRAISLIDDLSVGLYFLNVNFVDGSQERFKFFKN